MTAATPARPETDADLAAVIADGASRLRVELDTAQIARVVAYLRLIERWNGTYNLTAVRDLQAMATQHILDSIAVIPPLRRLLESDLDRRVLDVGSGAGLPGVVIAIVDAATRVVCVDSVGKKTAFVTQVAATLALGNLSAIHARVESMRQPPAFPVIISRAFASLGDFVASTRHLLHSGGWWVAMKGKVPESEVLDMAQRGVRFQVQPVVVPGLNADRCVLIGQPHRESEH